jgi:periplasmic divalent cation tolerance protein
MTDFVLLYATFPTKEEAKLVGTALLEDKLLACVNIIPKAESLYWWEGNIESTEEIILIAKTTKELERPTIEYIKKAHSYNCPCIISLPISSGNEQFLSWIDNSTKK